MIVLVLNSGSSTLKFQLFEMKGEQVLARGVVDRIGMPEATIDFRAEGRPDVHENREVLDHGQAVSYVLSLIPDRRNVDAVGHRVVHGGERFKESVLIDDDVLDAIRDCADLAPLHNPHNLRGISACAAALPGVPQIAVFDTAFHQTMAPEAFMYALPMQIYRRHKVRRYGFHGTSHGYVYDRLKALHDRPGSLRAITAHLGNGCSVAAIRDGKVVDTSMGMTPLEGLVMGTRSGDLDPAIVLHVMAKDDLSPGQASALLNKMSGLAGLSGVSSDMRELLQEEEGGNAQAKLAIDVFCHRLRKAIAAHAASLGGLDALVFTAGIGCNAAAIRARACKGLEFLGVELDLWTNDRCDPSRESRISTDGARVQTWVIPTDEELAIARDTARIAGR